MCLMQYTLSNASGVHLQLVRKVAHVHSRSVRSDKSIVDTGQGRELAKKKN